jgi:uncharacterized protein (UPF0276 family)
MHRASTIQGAGLGLRRPHLAALLDAIPAEIDFMEVAPENWLGAGGRLGEAFSRIATRVPMVCHGLLLNLGGPDPLDHQHIGEIGAFLGRHDVRLYGDHLSFCGESGLLYELLPMPFTEDAARHVAARVREVQDLLGRRITVENPSFYCALMQDISELEFINLVLEESDCLLLLDVNNVYVNSINHHYDAEAFMRGLPGERIAYAHIAGHLRTEEGLLIDTHGEQVSDPVWDLLAHAYQTHGVFPTLLERDENIPELGVVLEEVRLIRSLQAEALARVAA